MLRSFKVTKEYKNSRFDRYFKNNIQDIPQALLEKLIRKKIILVNGLKSKSSYRVQIDDLITIKKLPKVFTNKKKNTIFNPSSLEVKNYEKIILHNNENFIVINKPCGIAVQSGTKSFKNIFDLLKKTQFVTDNQIYTVHRLDKETSGVMIYAKNRKYAQLLTSLFRLRSIHKTYHAVITGSLGFKKKVVEDVLSYKIKNREIKQKAISNFKEIKTNKKYSLIEIKPLTGRKHQIRKQLLKLNNPIIGDSKYSDKKINKKDNLLLHSFGIKFFINNRKYEFFAPYPDNFKKFLEKI